LRVSGRELASHDAHHKTRTIAPDVQQCPRCGTCSPRSEIRSRFFWAPSLERSTIVEVRFGCYICPSCPKGQRWHTALPPDYRTIRQYTVSAFEWVVQLVGRYKMTIDGAAAVAREILNLPVLNATTVLDWLRDAGDGVDIAARREAMVKAFSGQMTVDEVYDGDWYQLKATDPLNDLELAWHLDDGEPTEADVREFFEGLKAMGFYPKLVTTDGSPLYPKVIKEVWPDAKHQRCVFHFVKQANDDLGGAFRAAYDTMPKPPKRKRGRPKKRGRPRKDGEKRANRRKVRAARYLFLKRDSRLTDEERAALDGAIALCPTVGVLRRFVVGLHELFGPTTDTQKLAEERRQALLANEEFAGVDGIETVLQRLRDDDLFARLTRYLAFENAEKTSNHVERENREFRKRQKTHYRLRSRESVCALLDLLTVRKQVPAEPQRLRKKTIRVGTVDEEVRAAA